MFDFCGGQLVMSMPPLSSKKVAGLTTGHPDTNT